MNLATQTRRWTFTLWTLIGLCALEAILVWLSPAEKILGNVVKWVYLHGAMARIALVFFAFSVLINVAYLVRPTQTLRRWSAAIAVTALILWSAHTVASMIPTYLTWGVWIQWSEPRTQFTFNVFLVALVVHATVHFMIDQPRLAALIYALLGGLVVGILPWVGLIRHPLDPVGTSPSPAIRLFYLALLGVTLLIGVVLAIALSQRQPIKS